MCMLSCRLGGLRMWEQPPAEHHPDHAPFPHLFQWSSGQTHLSISLSTPQTDSNGAMASLFVFFQTKDGIRSVALLCAAFLRLSTATGNQARTWLAAKACRCQCKMWWASSSLLLLSALTVCRPFASRIVEISYLITAITKFIFATSHPEKQHKTNFLCYIVLWLKWLVLSCGHNLVLFPFRKQQWRHEGSQRGLLALQAAWGFQVLITSASFRYKPSSTIYKHWTSIA